MDITDRGQPEIDTFSMSIVKSKSETFLGFIQLNVDRIVSNKTPSLVHPHTHAPTYTSTHTNKKVTVELLSGLKFLH